MATMYPLFFGALLVTVCGIVGAGDGAVGTHDVRDHVEMWHATPLRNRIIQIATADIDVREATGRNDGKRIEEYLQYTGLGKGHQWCAAFVSWCYGQAGLPEPRNPWSPALFPKARTYVPRGTSLGIGARVLTRAPIHKADIFGIYSITATRINHVGLVREVQGQYLLTIEGNSNDRVESRRRHLSTIYALADWVGKI